VKVDNLPVGADPRHHFLDGERYAAADTTARLIRTAQKWKTWQEHARWLYRARGLAVTGATIFEAMYSVDYSEPWGDGETSAFKS
jgi:hypothetical protein